MAGQGIAGGQPIAPTAGFNVNQAAAGALEQGMAATQQGLGFTPMGISAQTYRPTTQRVSGTQQAFGYTPAQQRLGGAQRAVSYDPAQQQAQLLAGSIVRQNRRLETRLLRWPTSSSTRRTASCVRGA